MLTTGNVSDGGVPQKMHSPKKGEEIGPGAVSDGEDQMEESVLEAVLQDLNKISAIEEEKDISGIVGSAIDKAVKIRTGLVPTKKAALETKAPAAPAVTKDPAVVVENTRVTGFRGLFKEGMQVSGDHRNRARRKMASWMGV